MTASQTKERSKKENCFSFTAENLIIIQAYIAKYPPGRQASAVLPLLDLAQRQCGGWLPQSAIEEVARILSMPAIRVYEVASFYTMFNLRPVGKFHVQICGTTPCWLRGAADIRTACENHLGIETGTGQLTPDGNFSLSEVECLGACVNAPMIQINDHYYEDLSPEAVLKLLDDLAEGRLCSRGSVVGRQASAPQGFVSTGPLFTNPAPAKRTTQKNVDKKAGDPENAA